MQTLSLPSAQAVPESNEVMIWQGFGKDIRQLILRIYVLNPDLLTFNEMLEVMVLQSDMFGTWSHLLRICHSNARLIILVDQTETWF